MSIALSTYSRIYENLWNLNCHIVVVIYQFHVVVDEMKTSSFAFRELL